jgi:hypothetical protein
MSTVFVNASVSDDERRRRLYQGHLFLYAASDATMRLVQVARDLCEEAFAPLHPTEAQHHMPVETYVEILKELKPRFIHHPRCKDAIRRILASAGCDLDKTYFDVPRLRTATSHEYLTSGLGYVFKPHRDTWYSTPMSQLNWWFPVYPVESENVMALHMHYWDRAIANSSHLFNYQDWNQTGRKEAATLVKKDTRVQSEALEPVDVDPQLRIVAEPGGLLIFSAAHLHSSVPNTSGKTRISIDFRTVHLDDLAARGGAPNVDSACTGTTIHDYLRGSDLSQVPADVMALYVDEPVPVEGLSPQFREEAKA